MAAMRARGDRTRVRKEKNEVESRSSEQTTRFKKRLQRLREHHNKCFLKTQSSGSPNQGETSSELSKERHAASNICEASLDTGEEPDVPPLIRTDSVILTKEYLKQISKVADNSEASVSCIESSDDEYIPPEESVHDTSSDGSGNRKSKVPLTKLKKPQRTYRKKTQRRDTSDKDSRISESETSDDTNAVSVMKLQKKADGARVYNKAHYCLYCPKKCYKMARHLARKHSSEPAVAKALRFPLKSKARKLHLDLIRNRGDRAHNNEVLKSLQTLKEAKWNTPQLLPFTEDVKKMHMHLNKCREEYQDKLKTKPNRKNWSKLANVTLCEVILFNRRREADVSKMPLSAFALRDTSGVHSDLAEGLSELEQKLCQHFQRIEITGKRNRKVPVLLTPDMLSSMELLVAHRRECGVPDDNPFFFSRPEADTHLRGSHAIRQIARECGAKHPETLSSTKLRKQVSTLSTVLNLKDNEMDTLANFLGHDILVHRQYYRLPEGTLQLAKVSKVLIALEQGRLSDFKGMTLDQIQLDPKEEVPEVLDSDLSETEMDSTLCSPSSGPSALQMRQDTDESDSDAPKPGPSTYKKRKKPTEPDISKPEATKRKSWSAWSAVEVRAVEKTLNSFIQSVKVPGKSACVACIEASPEALQSRTWKAVKFYVKNRIAAIQRESTRRDR